MSDAPAREDPRDRLSERRRDAIWKWRWLGFKDSTPAFKASLVLLAVVALVLIAYGFLAFR
jgi:hypothetical protein